MPRFKVKTTFTTFEDFPDDHDGLTVQQLVDQFKEEVAEDPLSYLKDEWNHDEEGPPSVEVISISDELGKVDMSPSQDDTNKVG